MREIYNYFPTDINSNIKGSIKTGPKNFLTNPNKKGLGNTTVGHLFNPVEYGSDPYHRENDLDLVRQL